MNNNFGHSVDITLPYTVTEPGMVLIGVSVMSGATSGSGGVSININNISRHYLAAHSYIRNDVSFKVNIGDVVKLASTSGTYALVLARFYRK